MTDIAIAPFTPLIRMRYQAILRRALTWTDELAAEFGVTPDDLWYSIQKYAQLATRVQNLNGQADFDFALATDSAEIVKEKFMAFMQTDNPALVWKLEELMDATDKPVDEALTPTPPDTDDPE